MPRRWGIAITVRTASVTRWILVATPFGGVVVSRLVHLSGAEHDAPFVSLVVSGGYIERRYDVGLDLDRPIPTRVRTVGDLNVVNRRRRHGIVSLVNAPVWTVAIVGRPQLEGIP